MSVLYKALQKAAKENEQAAAASGEATEAPVSSFDASRLAGSGAISAGRFGALGANWRVAGIAAAVVLAVALALAFFLVDSEPDRPAVAVAPAPQEPPAPAPSPEPEQAMADVEPVAEPPAEEPATSQPEVTADASPAPAPSSEPAPAASPAPTESAADTPAPAVDVAQAEPMAAAEPAEAEAEAAPSEPVPPVQTPQPAQPAQVAAAPRMTPPSPSEPMPELDRDSPTRVLSPPINIRRAEAEFSGAGNVVQVRRVSQEAQDGVTAGYAALVRGEYDTALLFYDRALEQEPRSVLALLGRGSALQKLGRLEDARVAYERVLRIDPQNREALTNLTAVFSERAPNEALTRLLELEKEYPRFSPITAQIGLLYARMGSMDNALTYLRNAASASPGTVMYQYNLAVLLDRLGRYEQAVVAYERTLAGIISGSGPAELSRVGIERRVRYLKTL